MGSRSRLRSGLDQAVERAMGGATVQVSLDLWRRVIVITDQDADHFQGAVTGRRASNFLRLFQVIIDRLAGMGEFGSAIKRTVRIEGTKIHVILDGSALKAGGGDGNW